jgi:PAS domain S-box-containing protein
MDVTTVAEAIPHVVWMANSEGVGDYLNSRALELTGLTRETLSGSGWLEVVHPDDRELAARVWTDAVASGRLYEDEYRVRDCEGQYRRMQARALPISSKSGERIRWIGTWTDVEDDRLLRDRRTILKLSGASGRVATQLARDRRGRTSQLTSDRADPEALALRSAISSRSANDR